MIACVCGGVVEVTAIAAIGGSASFAVFLIWFRKLTKKINYVKKR